MTLVFVKMLIITTFRKFKLLSKTQQQLKNQSSHREVPIHSALLKAGLAKFASQAQGRLFPELKKINGKYGHSVSQWFRKYREKCGITEPGKTFHSFRHTIATQLMRADADEKQVAALLGHSLSGETFGRYGKSFSPEQLKKLIELVKHPISPPDLNTRAESDST